VRIPRRKAQESAIAYRRSEEVTIRWATNADEASLETLAELEDAPVPAAPVLLGLVGGEVWVAASVSSGTVIADPFRPAAEVARLVVARGAQLRVPLTGR
jgi:hypothetical protein